MLLTQLITVPVMGVMLAASGNADWCRGPNNVSVSLTPRIAATEYVRSDSSDMLSALHTSKPFEEGAVGGLGGGTLGIKTRSEFQIVTLGQRSCIALKSISLEFFAEPKIHIASNFKRGSCEYSAVLAHEQKHIAELRKIHREYRPKLRRKLRDIAKIIKPVGPISSSNVEKAQKVMSEKISQEINKYHGNIVALLDRRQARIDTPKEYARVSAQCRNWDKKLYGDKR